MSSTDRHVWIIVGYTGVGKTTLVNLLIERTAMKVLSFRSVTKQFCQREGYKGVRDYFASVPESKFVDSINNYVLSEIDRMFVCSSDFIVEGLPSISVVEKLKRHRDVLVTVICLEATVEVRKNRVRQRAAITSEDAGIEELTKNKFKEALGIENVIASADYTLDTTKDPNVILEDLISIICPQSLREEPV